MNRITPRILLAHSAGLSGQIFTGYPAKDPLPDIRQVLAGEKPAVNLPVLEGIQPGKARESESGYAILQLLLTDLEGKAFPRIMKETVLDPLGLKNSTFEVSFARGTQGQGGLRASPGRPGGGRRLVQLS